MSKLDELIQQLCPDGVEYKHLGLFISIYTGEQFNKRDMNDNGSYPVINGGILPSGYIESYNEKSNTITISQGGASAGHVAWQTTYFWAGAHCYVIKPLDDRLNNKYLYHFIKSKETYLKQMQHGAGIPALNRTKIQQIEIPLPPLPVQEEIVRILDTFTESTNNLKEQIQTRRKQYEYYRDQLLDLEGKDGVEMKTLGEIGEFIRGTGIQKADFVEDGFPCIHYGQIHTKYGLSANSTLSNVNEALYHRSRKAEYGDVVLATTSEDAECVAKPVAWLGKEKVAISGDAYIFHHKENGKYMAHLFSSHRFFLFKIKHATGAKVVRISGDNMAKFEFPLPSLQEQHRIVTILDQFEASIANLEAQLKEREKQYEYYRNQLLDFKKKEE